MIRGVVSPTLNRWMELFPEIVNCLLKAITKMFGWMFCWDLNLRFYDFNSYMRLHQLVQYANLIKVKNLNKQFSNAMNTCEITDTFLSVVFHKMTFLVYLFALLYHCV